MKDQQILTDNNFLDFIDNLVIEQDIKERIMAYFDSLNNEKEILKFNLKGTEEDFSNLEDKYFKLKEEHSKVLDHLLDRHLDEKAHQPAIIGGLEDHENMINLGYAVTLVDDMKSQLLKENWHNFSLEQLDNFIKTL